VSRQQKPQEEGAPRESAPGKDAEAFPVSAKMKFQLLSKPLIRMIFAALGQVRKSMG
jgi:hypothetical protein